MHFLKNKKILITGGLGFIGSNLAKKCLEFGAKVTIFDNLDTHSGGNLYNILDFKSKVHLCFHDILDYDRLVENVFDKDIIFNCAASTSHPYSMREPWLDMDANSRGVINLLEAIRRFNNQAIFIHIGTTTQMGKLIYAPADELHPEFPVDMYSANKSVSEKYVLLYSNAYGMKNTVIRFSNVFGPRASIHSSDFTFNNYFMGLALQGKEITVYGNGNQIRNSIYIDDAINALILAAQSNAVFGETILAVHNEHLSVSEIAKATVEEIGKGEVKYISWPNQRKTLEIGDAIFTNKKIKNILGWNPQFTVRDGLKFSKDYYKSRLKYYIK